MFNYEFSEGPLYPVYSKCKLCIKISEI